MLARFGPLLILTWTCVSLPAQTVRKDDSLPGYWEFFAKTGSLRVIPPERARDAAIAKGRIAPRKIAKPLPDVALPDETGHLRRLRAIAEGRPLVVVTYRAWW